MPRPKVSLAARVREVNAAAQPVAGDVAAVFADHHCKDPRERFVLVAIAAVPNATVEQLADMTGMTTSTVREAISYLLKDEDVYATLTGGFITQSAVVIA